MQNSPCSFIISNIHRHPSAIAAGIATLAVPLWSARGLSFRGEARRESPSINRMGRGVHMYM